MNEEMAEEETTEETPQEEIFLDGNTPPFTSVPDDSMDFLEDPLEEEEEVNISFGSVNINVPEVAFTTVVSSDTQYYEFPDLKNGLNQEMLDKYGFDIKKFYSSSNTSDIFIKKEKTSTKHKYQGEQKLVTICHGIPEISNFLFDRLSSLEKNDFSSIKILNKILDSFSYQLSDVLFEDWIKALVDDYILNILNIVESNVSSDSSLQSNKLSLNEALATYDKNNHKEALHIKDSVKKFFNSESLEGFNVISFTANEITLKDLVRASLLPLDFDFFKQKSSSLDDYNEYVNFNNEKKSVPIVYNRIYSLIMMGILLRKIYLLDFTRNHITIVLQENTNAFTDNFSKLSEIKSFVNEYGDCFRIDNDELLVSFGSIISIWKQDLRKYFKSIYTEGFLHLALDNLIKNHESSVTKLKKQVKLAEMVSSNDEGFGWS